ncbi:MAG: HAMP domain-containing sensor histidine kinase [Gemmatimonadales bacterium]
MVRSDPTAGTVVVLTRLLPDSTRPDAETVARVNRGLATLAPHDPLFESREQNQELLRALAELRERQVEVERLNHELAKTNRGVLALYAELDEKAAELALGSEHKSRFLSNISHALRTPLGAIINITGLLLERADGPLKDEQERQVRFVRGAAAALSEMVNDLLDLARIEAGRSVVRTGEFTAADLFSALRGMFRALSPSDAVAVVFDEPCDLPPLVTDEGELSPILRNFIANALKFTERGECASRRGARRTAGWRSRSRTAAWASPPRIRSGSSRSSLRWRARSSARRSGPAWACRSRGGWPSCSGAR